MMKLNWARTILADILLAVFIIPISTASKSRKVSISYPVELMQPVTGTLFEGKLNRDQLTCFGNRDYGVPTFIETLGCIFNLPGYTCPSIWGSRSVMIEADGNVEFFRVNRLPKESQSVNAHSTLAVTRWLHISTENGSRQREVKQVPVEPLYLCARSNSWKKNSTARINVQFRPMYMRERDKSLCRRKIFLHLGLLLAVSSLWLLPYLSMVVAATFAFSNGLNYFIMCLVISCCVVLFTPLMLTRKNRHITRSHFSHLFTRVQAEETKLVIKERLPVLQAFFFSCLIVCMGSAGSYVMYAYCGVDRETRNQLFKITLSLAAAWFSFFLCKSFERFLKEWLWLLLAVGFVKVVDSHVNPLSREEIFVWSVVITFVVKNILSRISRFIRFRRIITLALPKLQVVLNTIGFANKKSILQTSPSSMNLNGMEPTLPPFNTHPSTDVLRGGGAISTGTTSSGSSSSNALHQTPVTPLATQPPIDIGDLIMEPTSHSIKSGGGSECDIDKNSEDANDDDDDDEDAEEDMDAETVVDEIFQKDMTTANVHHTHTHRRRRSDSINSVHSVLPHNSAALWDSLMKHRNSFYGETNENDNNNYTNYLSDNGDSSSRHSPLVTKYLSHQNPERRNRFELSLALGMDLSCFDLWGIMSSKSDRNYENDDMRQGGSSNNRIFDADDDDSKYQDSNVEKDDEDEIIFSVNNNNNNNNRDRRNASRSSKENSTQSRGTSNSSNLSDIYLATSPNSSFPFPHIIGTLLTPISVQGPITIDGMKCWIPLATIDQQLVECVQIGLSLLLHNHPITTTVFDGLYECLNENRRRRSVQRTATVSVTSTLHSLELLHWISTSNNMAILRGIIAGAESGLDDLSIRASVLRSTSISIALRFVCDMSYSAIQSRHHHPHISTASGSMSEPFSSVGSRGLEALLLALTEQFSYADFKVIKIDYRNLESNEGYLGKTLLMVAEGRISSKELEHHVEYGHQKLLMTQSLLGVVEEERRQLNDTSAALTSRSMNRPQETALRAVSAVLLAIGVDPMGGCMASSFAEVMLKLDDNSRPNTKNKYDKSSSQEGQEEITCSLSMPSLILPMDARRSLQSTHLCCRKMLLAIDDIADQDKVDIYLAKALSVVVMATYLSVLVILAKGDFINALFCEDHVNNESEISDHLVVDTEVDIS